MKQISDFVEVFESKVRFNRFTNWIINRSAYHRSTAVQFNRSTKTSGEIEMVSFREALNVLNCAYLVSIFDQSSPNFYQVPLQKPFAFRPSSKNPMSSSSSSSLTCFSPLLQFLITGKLVGTIMRAYLASKHSEVPFMPPTLAWILLAVIIFGCRFLGETALKKNRPGQLKCYAVLVLVCVVWQVSAENYHVCTCNLNQTDVNRFVKQEIIAKFDSYPKQIQQCIQKSQQVLGCCGVDSWTDFGKLPNEMPGKSIGSALVFHSI